MELLWTIQQSLGGRSPRELLEAPCVSFPLYGSLMTTIPDSLHSAFEAWARAGHPAQGSFRWRPASWVRRFSRTGAPQIPGVDLVEAVHTIDAASRTKFGEKSPRIDRDLVTSLHRPETLSLHDDATSPQSVVTAFIAAMIWGYGTTGYGPYRTERVLATDPHAVEHLRQVAEIAQGTEQGGLAAFTEISQQRGPRGSSYLKYLGPAFGTKFLYFLTAAVDGVETTPVMDAVVRRWFATEPRVPLDTTGWVTDSYRTYLDHLDQWRRKLSAEGEEKTMSREDVELLIFATAQGDADTWEEGSETVLPEDLSADQLLDLLQSDIEKLAETAGPKGPELFHQLSEWVANTDIDHDQPLSSTDSATGR